MSFFEWTRLTTNRIPDQETLDEFLDFVFEVLAAAVSAFPDCSAKRVDADIRRLNFYSTASCLFAPV